MSSPNTTPRQAWPDYRTVWRWHFYASLFCMPLVIILSITGAIYLFRPQIEGWLERDVNHLSLTGNPAAVSAQVQAAMHAHPGSIPTAYEFPPTANGAPRVILQAGGESQRVFVHPETLEVLRSQPDRDTFVRQIRSLHGQLGMGERGSNLVELAASWTIIMLVTGLYLWWPRSAKGLGGVLYPRLGKGSKVFLRDLHSVTGIWISTLVLFLLVTGLPWAKFWGNYFRTIRDVTGTAVAKQDWTIGGEKPKQSGGEHAGHNGSSRAVRGPEDREKLLRCPKI